MKTIANSFDQLKEGGHLFWDLYDLAKKKNISGLKEPQRILLRNVGNKATAEGGRLLRSITCEIKNNIDSKYYCDTPKNKEAYRKQTCNEWTARFTVSAS